METKYKISKNSLISSFFCYLCQAQPEKDVPDLTKAIAVTLIPADKKSRTEILLFLRSLHLNYPAKSRLIK